MDTSFVKGNDFMLCMKYMTGFKQSIKELRKKNHDVFGEMVCLIFPKTSWFFYGMVITMENTDAGGSTAY